MKKKLFTLNILGTTYTVYTSSSNCDPILEKNDGYVCPETNTIVLDEKNNPVHNEHVLTHELVHAFLHESGLDVETWAVNEEIVDWIALQLFKINKTALEGIKSLRKKDETTHN